MSNEQNSGLLFYAIHDHQVCFVFPQQPLYKSYISIDLGFIMPMSCTTIPHLPVLLQCLEKKEHNMRAFREL
jgi:hypothetical protein